MKVETEYYRKLKIKKKQQKAFRRFLKGVGHSDWCPGVDRDEYSGVEMGVGGEDAAFYELGELRDSLGG